jgi:hypothetical protein
MVKVKPRIKVITLKLRCSCSIVATFRMLIVATMGLL